jgi:hypothetical protein
MGCHEQVRYMLGECAPVHLTVHPLPRGNQMLGNQMTVSLLIVINVTRDTLGG